MLGQDPADCSNSGRSTNYSMQCNLSNLHERDIGTRRIYNKMVEDVLICVDQKRILTSQRNHDHGGRELLHVDEREIIQSTFSRVQAQLKNSSLALKISRSRHTDLVSFVGFNRCDQYVLIPTHSASDDEIVLRLTVLKSSPPSATNAIMGQASPAGNGKISTIV